MSQTKMKKSNKLEKRMPATGFLTEKGLCPVDGTPLEFVVFDESAVGLGLLSESFPYMTRFCPHCLVASNDKSFFEQTTRPDIAAQDSGADTAPAIRMEYVRLLPLRLAAIKRALRSFSAEALALLVDDRRWILEGSLEHLIRRGVPSPSADTVATLVQHGINLLSTNAGLDDLTDKLVKHPGFASRLSQDSALALLIREGADPSVAAQSCVYGALISVFDANGLARLAESPLMRQETALFLALLHQELVRITVYARQLAMNNAIKTQAQQAIADADSTRLAENVEEFLQAEVTKRSQDGYDCLYLGMSYYRTSMTDWCLLNLRAAPIEERLKELAPAIWKAIIFLELTVLAEHYPQFVRSDKIASLNIKGRLKVPFLYGEFGVRHVLCFLYNELGKMRREADEDPEMDVLDVAAEIKAHWLAVHERFCQLEFGGARDPATVQVLTPRLIAFATTCFHKETADLLKQTILDNRTRLYGRYMAEGLTLASNIS